jgi:hypothetical protein
MGCPAVGQKNGRCGGLLGLEAHRTGHCGISLEFGIVPPHWQSYIYISCISIKTEVPTVMGRLDTTSGKSVSAFLGQST